MSACTPAGDGGAEVGLDLGARGRRVLDRVVEERAGDREIGVSGWRGGERGDHLARDSREVQEVWQVRVGDGLAEVALGGEPERGHVAIGREHAGIVPRSRKPEPGRPGGSSGYRGADRPLEVGARADELARVAGLGRAGAAEQIAEGRGREDRAARARDALEDDRRAGHDGRRARRAGELAGVVAIASGVVQAWRSP